MKKRVWSIFLSSLMILALLVGCQSGSSGSKSNGKIKLVMWDLFSGGDGDFMKEMINEFNKSQSDIEVETVTLEWAEYYTKLVTAVAAGKGPDIGISHTSKLPEIVDQGLATELDPLADSIKLDWDSYNKNILDATVFDGKHYAVPIDTHPIVFYYNKKHLDAAGLLDENGMPKIESGAKGFSDFMNTLKANDSKLTTFAFPTAGDDPFRLWWALYHQLGGYDVVSDDLTSPQIDKPKAIEAANFMKDLYYKDKVIPLNMEDFYQPFQTGNAATIITGVWATGTFEKTEGLDFGVIPLPTLYNTSATWGDSHTIFLPVQKKEDTEKAQAALQFANFIADHGQIWTRAGHIPSKTTVVESEEFKNLPYRSDYEKAAQQVVFPKQSNKVWPIKDIIIRNLDTIWAEKETPEDAFNKMETEIAELLSK
ncbi:ABC transporter substrate-binding protein [Lederbergia wuyishanensis]|uniref:Multiple sugar transport system substrate-binding protein n=1 Tax=Lederbergia wuyishanensis TaxID=1347903 RepID=A0ABU0D9G7_9BACI|nr:ABC transporter substrate-binding protein [Lederbergia wuyishanensis]MCJ8007492.1 ABC transporter substrate-binding protein [Lederbergia wuyishanensis]MDQ0345069.1 multiple sugar transport system substrate-binding protein [Lederbergia wuyishanensis]